MCENKPDGSVIYVDEDEIAVEGELETVGEFHLITVPAFLYLYFAPG